jgi:sensor histidine kinase YesM
MNSAVNAASLLSSMVLILPVMVINFVFSLSGRFICRFFPATWINFYKTVSVQTIFCALSAGVWFLAWYIYANMVMSLTPSLFNQVDFYHAVPLVVPMVVSIDIVFILIHYIVLYIEKNRIATEELLQHKLFLAEAELKALKNTIHPHFLFNSLSMLQSLMTQSPEKTSGALAALSEYLLYSVQFSKKNSVSIAEEITHAKNYGDLELMRRNNSFSIHYDIDNQCSELVVIPFIIQPLIENAIKHGIDLMEQGGVISLYVGKTEKNVVLSVSNTIGSVPPPTGKKSGTGLDTLSRRITAAFGSDATFSIEHKGNEFKVTITFPLKRSSSLAN